MNLPQEKRTGPQIECGNFPTSQSVSKRTEVNLLDVFDAAQVGRQVEGTIAIIEVGVALADELDNDARESPYKQEK